MNVILSANPFSINAGDESKTVVISVIESPFASICGTPSLLSLKLVPNLAEAVTFNILPVTTSTTTFELEFPETATPGTKPAFYRSA